MIISIYLSIYVDVSNVRVFVYETVYYIKEVSEKNSLSFPNQIT